MSLLIADRQCQPYFFIETNGTKRDARYEVHPRKDKRGFDLISDALPFGRLWYLKIPDAIGYAKHRSRSHDAVIQVYDAARVLMNARHLVINGLITSAIVQGNLSTSIFTRANESLEE